VILRQGVIPMHVEGFTATETARRLRISPAAVRLLTAYFACSATQKADSTLRRSQTRLALHAKRNNVAASPVRRSRSSLGPLPNPKVVPRRSDVPAPLCRCPLPEPERNVNGAAQKTLGINRVADVGFFSGIPLRSEAIVVLDKLRKVSRYVRKGWSSTDPDSYSHYKRGRERQRKQAERSREEAHRSAELNREEVQRGREYEERYAAERAAEEPQTEPPRDDTDKPE
jgi:hypothetical protein